MDLWRFEIHRRVFANELEDLSSKNKKLHQEARVQGEPRVIIPKPAGDTHNSGAQGNFCKRTENIHRSQRAVAQPENNKEREEIKERSQRRGQCRPAVLNTLKEEFQEDDVQHNIQNK